MSSAKAVLGSWLGRFVFREARIVAVEQPADHFRKLTLRGPALCDADWIAGSKLQIFLPEVGMRTYTPLGWNRVDGSTQLLVYLHGTSPGASWARAAQVGESVQFFGPRRSLDATGLPSAVLLVGDETSFGVAHALGSRLQTGQLKCVFEVSSLAENRGVLESLGLSASELIARHDSDSHLDAMYAAIRQRPAEQSELAVVLTGRATAIQALRTLLKRDGARVAKSKAYWAAGKAGLD